MCILIQHHINRRQLFLLIISIFTLLCFQGVLFTFLFLILLIIIIMCLHVWFIPYYFIQSVICLEVFVICLFCPQVLGVLYLKFQNYSWSTLLQKIDIYSHLISFYSLTFFIMTSDNMKKLRHRILSGLTSLDQFDR